VWSKGAHGRIAGRAAAIAGRGWGFVPGKATIDKVANRAAMLILHMPAHSEQTARAWKALVLRH
jgi:hypothetical protein